MTVEQIAWTCVGVYLIFGGLYLLAMYFTEKLHGEEESYLAYWPLTLILWPIGVWLHIFGSSFSDFRIWKISVVCPICSARNGVTEEKMSCRVCGAHLSPPMTSSRKRAGAEELRVKVMRERATAYNAELEALEKK